MLRFSYFLDVPLGNYLGIVSLDFLLVTDGENNYAYLQFGCGD